MSIEKSSVWCAAGTIHKTNSFGKVRVIKYYSSHKVLVEFLRTGYRTMVQSTKISRGSIKDPMAPNVFGIGYIGCGEYKSRNEGKLDVRYRYWHAMMERCYSPEYLKKRPSYIGCEVCESWHSYQNFCIWFDENYPNDGERYDLDKDIKVSGNKLYSPETCKFVTPKENSIKARAKNYKFKNSKSEVVDIYNLNEFCQSNGLSRPNMLAVYAGRRKSHKGWTKAT